MTNHFLETFQRKTTAGLRYRLARRWLYSSGLFERFGDIPEGSSRPSPVLMRTLYKTVRRRAPDRVLEFGVGNSTIAMAQAMHENGHGLIRSIDASKDWIAAFRRRVPAELLPYIEVCYSPCERTQYAGIECHRYVSVPRDFNPQMIFLDGPDAADVPGWGRGRDQLAADVLDLEPILREGLHLIVDARLANVAFLDQYLTRKWRRAHDAIFKITTYDLIA